MDSSQNDPLPVDARQRRFTFGLAGLLLLITLIGVSLGLVIAVPGVGIPVAVLGAPAAVRAWLVASRRREAGRPLDAFERLPLFFSSLAVVTTLVVASSVAFAAVCFPIGLAAFGGTRNGSTFLMVVGWLLGFAAGGAVLYFLARRLWPYRERPRGLIRRGLASTPAPADLGSKDQNGGDSNELGKGP